MAFHDFENNFRIRGWNVEYSNENIENNSVYPRGEPRMELGVHVFGIMWNYFGIH